MTHRVEPCFSVIQKRDATVVVMSGEFDHQAGKELHAALVRLLNDSPAAVVVDMTAVDFIDSGGIEMLLRLHGRIVRDGGGTMRVSSASATARRTLGVLGLLELLGFESDSAHDASRGSAG